MSALTLTSKEQRIKYIRALERFVNSCSSALKNEVFQWELFEKRVHKSLATLRKVTPVRLDAHYLNLLEAYVTLVQEMLQEEKTTAEMKQRTLLKEANLIEKERNQSSYKKAKHKHHGFDDGY